jgi:hypothetical protein
MKCGGNRRMNACLRVGYMCGYGCEKQEYLPCYQYPRIPGGQPNAFLCGLQQPFASLRTVEQQNGATPNRDSGLRPE